MKFFTNIKSRIFSALLALSIILSAFISIPASASIWDFDDTWTGQDNQGNYVTMVINGNSITLAINDGYYVIGEFYYDLTSRETCSPTAWGNLGLSQVSWPECFSPVGFLYDSTTNLLLSPVVNREEYVFLSPDYTHIYFFSSNIGSGSWDYSAQLLRANLTNPDDFCGEWSNPIDPSNQQTMLICEDTIIMVGNGYPNADSAWHFSFSELDWVRTGPNSFEVTGIITTVTTDINNHFPLVVGEPFTLQLSISELGVTITDHSWWSGSMDYVGPTDCLDTPEPPEPPDPPIITPEPPGTGHSTTTDYSSASLISPITFALLAASILLATRINLKKNISLKK